MLLKQYKSHFFDALKNSQDEQEIESFFFILVFASVPLLAWTNLGSWLNLRLRQLSKAVYRGSAPEEIDNW